MLKVFFISFSIFWSIFSYSDNCQKTIQRIYDQPNFAPSYKDIFDEIGKENFSTKEKQVQYSWGDFIVIMQGRKVIFQHGASKASSPHKKNHPIHSNINKYIEELGAPKRISIKYIKKQVWKCKNGSFLEIYVSDKEIIQRYSGKLCRDKSDLVCSKFSRNLIPLTHD